jgi:hypothetical protein
MTRITMRFSRLSLQARTACQMSRLEALSAGPSHVAEHLLPKGNPTQACVTAPEAPIMLAITKIICVRVRPLATIGHFLGG